MRKKQLTEFPQTSLSRATHGVAAQTGKWNIFSKILRSCIYSGNMVAWQESIARLTQVFIERHKTLRM